MTKTFWEELKEVRTTLLKILIFFTVAFLVILTISVEWRSFLTVPIPVPGASGGSIPSYFIQSIRADLVPENVNVAATTPLEAFGVYVGISAAFALALTFFYILYEGWRFAAPGLYREERRGLAAVLVVSGVLLYAGALFAYDILIPLIYKGLYAFMPPGIVALYGLGDLVWQVLGMMLVCALAFLLPVVMFLATLMGFVPLHFWRENWRYAFIGVLGGTAILTPDGSGASMVVLTIPICALYALGYAAAAYVLHYRKPSRPV
jgi:sec-independent protein translocase protein TatC